MPEPTPTPVFTVRLPIAAGGVQVIGKAEFMLDARVDRKLLVALLKHAIAMIEAGQAPAQIARLRP